MISPVLEWSPNIGVAGANNNIRTELPAGVYTINVIDPNQVDCSTTISVALGNIDGPQVDNIQIFPATCSDENGSVILEPDNFIYTWVFDQAQTNVRNDLAPGTYEIVVIDPADFSCANVIALEVTGEDILSATANIESEPDCGQANGIGIKPGGVDAG